MSLETFVGGMTVAQLAQASGTTVAEICTLAMHGGASPNRGASRHTSGGRASPAPNGLPKTDPATANLAARILEALGSSESPLRSADLGASVGGTPETRRYALKKLEAEGKIRRRGRARATTYQATR